MKGKKRMNGKGLMILLRLRQGETIRKIGREMQVSRSKIRKILSLSKDHQWLDLASSLPNEEEFLYIYNGPHFSKVKKTHILDPFYPKIESWKKENISAAVIWRLIQQECSCDIQVVQRYVRKHFPTLPEPVMIRVAISGEVMDVDFGFLGFFLDPEGNLRKVWFFSARLRYSRKAFRKIVLSQKLEVFFLCHTLAFEWFGGVPEKVVPDNLKAAVIKSTIDNDMVQRGYQELALHYQFIIDPCLPRTPEHKGGVENDVKYVKNNFLPFFKARQKEKGKLLLIADLEKALESWDNEVANVRKIYGVGKSPRELFEEEKKILKPLPLSRWEPIYWTQCTVHKEWRINHEGAYYSVPYEYIGKEVLVRSSPSWVKIFYDHPRSGDYYCCPHK